MCVRAVISITTFIVLVISYRAHADNDSPRLIVVPEIVQLPTLRSAFSAHGGVSFRHPDQHECPGNRRHDGNRQNSSRYAERIGEGSGEQRPHRVPEIAP